MNQNKPVYVFYNAHPYGLFTDDCVKRAISLTADMDYMEVQRQLNRYKKITGAKKFYSNKNPHRYVENMLISKKIDLKDKITAKDFCKKHRKGRYILDMKGHWSCEVDGVIYDTWDCSEELVNFAYEITPTTHEHVPRCCCAASQLPSGEIRINIYERSGRCTERTVDEDLADGYIRCLEDMNYSHVYF